MLNTEIRQFSTGYKFRMEVVYNTKTGRWILQFNCMQPGRNYGEEHSYTLFSEALKRFNSNCRYYGVPEQHCTEEEFLGLKPGTLYPTRKERKNG